MHDFLLLVVRVPCWDEFTIAAVSINKSTGRCAGSQYSFLVQGLYCVGDSTFPGQGVNAVVFSGFGCAHRVLCDLGKQPIIPVFDQAFTSVLSAVRDRA